MSVELFPNEREAPMCDFAISHITDFDISRDGKAVLNCRDEDGKPISIKMATMDLERFSVEIGFLLTKARELSEISKQNIVPFLQPAKFRADLLTQGSTVVIAFQLASGLQHHYGLEPTDADALACQILDAAEQAKKAAVPLRH
jgi:hypothetical protein